MTTDLLISLALLGLSAVDPLGLAAMPLLLTQKNPFVRSSFFLGGSFFALMVMGLLFAQGFGRALLDFDNKHTWLAPSVETAAGVILLVIAGVLVWRIRKNIGAPDETNSPALAVLRKDFGKWRLFILGLEIVAVQSLVDIVFVVAMIRVGQLHLSVINLLVCIVIYAIGALILQISIIVAYRSTPPDRRARTLTKVRKLLAQYADQAVIVISLLLGIALFVNGTLALGGETARHWWADLLRFGLPY